MKNLKKNKISKMILALVLILTLGMGSMSVLADSRASGHIGTYATDGGSEISADSAHAYTLFETSGAVKVSATCSFVNVNSLATRSESKSNGHNSHCDVNFNASSGWRCVKISSHHEVCGNGQTWTANTEAVY